jgi:aspartyl/asparaginyl beta-hydroxylase (cupin superfamily)
MQRPVIFYMPGLPAAPIEPNARFPWTAILEAAWPVIREEYAAALRCNTTMTPYVPANTRDERWRDLRGQQDWSAIHLYKDAARTPFAYLFPRTLDALSAVDLVSINGVPVEAFFSRLRPGAHIPPHFGLTNSRVTVHLPIDAPPGCSIRVGKEEYSWRDGEIVAFDDSFEHEAWNRSDRDRVVLIFEAPHPDLSPAERMAVEYCYGARQNWLNDRRRLIQQFAAQA